MRHDDREKPTGAMRLADLIRRATRGPIFHVPGEGVLELIDALEGDGSAGPSRLVTCRHENAAVTMAGVSGAMRGAPGVCLVGRAPGALNAALALHSCRTDETPVLLVVGDCTQHDGGRDIMLGEELVTALRAIAGHAVYCPAADRIEETFAAALNAAMLPRMGVGVLVVSDNAWHEAAAPSRPRAANWPLIAPPDIPAADAGRLVELMQRASKPVVIVGGGAWSNADADGLRAALERLRVPAVAAYRFNDILAADSPCAAGEIGIGADARLIAALDEADFVLLAGARLSEINTFASGSFQGFRLFNSGERFIAAVSTDPADAFSAYPVDLAAAGHPASVVEMLNHVTARAEWAQWQARLRHLREDYIGIPDADAMEAGDSRAIAEAINTLDPAAAVFTVGAGRYAHLPQRYLRTARPQRYFGPKSGAMGYGLPAAIGAALTDREARALCFAGDGCFAMSGFELATARLYDANVTCIIFNDLRFTAIAANQARHFGRAVGTDLAPIDFTALAASMGVPARRVESLEDFRETLRRSASMTGPFVIEVPVNRDGRCFVR